MADKELRLLEEGDELTTIWYMASVSGEDEFEAYTADTFTVTADTAFGEMELPDGSYSMVYEMRDAMDNYAYSDAVFFDCAGGEITTIRIRISREKGGGAAAQPFLLCETGCEHCRKK